jgi:hypothetical protein
MTMTPLSWLLLLYGLPSKHGAARLALWRQLKRIGAVPFKTSAYVLPDRPELYESFQWLAQRVREQGGEATLIRAAKVDGVTDGEVVRLFQQARAADYTEILKDARPLLPPKGRKAKSAADGLDKLTARFEAVRQIDFFECPAAAQCEALLRRLSAGGAAMKNARTLSPKSFRGKTWLTRPHPEVDRVGSAWLIARFIDPEAKFVFDVNADAFPDALPYDMTGVEFGHHGDDCTFETLLNRFSLSKDRALRQIAAIIHDADLGDGKNGRTEGTGLLAVFRGWARAGWTDDKILEYGFACFDGLHCAVSGREPKRKLTP